MITFVREFGSMRVLFYYLLGINLLTFLIYGIDKWKARRDKWRVPEATLLMLAALGGSVGALLGMSVFHHKTKHKKFLTGVPLILLAQVILAWLIFSQTV